MDTCASGAGGGSTTSRGRRSRANGKMPDKAAKGPLRQPQADGEGLRTTSEKHRLAVQHIIERLRKKAGWRHPIERMRLPLIRQPTPLFIDLSRYLHDGSFFIICIWKNTRPGTSGSYFRAVLGPCRLKSCGRKMRRERICSKFNGGIDLVLAWRSSTRHTTDFFPLFKK